MSDEIQTLLKQNKAWAEAVAGENPEFFRKLAQGQSPEYLWIGCADSRVPPTEIMGLAPGDVFVHRNIANVVSASDTSAMSVLQFSIGVVGVRHVIVCGHYGCAGVKAGMDQNTEGPVHDWLGGMRELWDASKDDLSGEDDAFSRFCELNVRQQVRTVCESEAVRNAWAAGKALDVHGWIFGLEDGLIRDLGYRASSVEEAAGL